MAARIVQLASHHRTTRRAPLPRWRFTDRVRSTIILWASSVALALAGGSAYGQPDISDDDWQLMRAAERTRIEAIERVIGSVVAIYGQDRQGGGSGVIIDPSGLALTNHHVIQGAGTEGWGGLADGKLYRWTVIGTDPGGDIALIRLQGRDDFPASRLGDSNRVRVGDWAMAMGNPFVLSEDETPTVTLGIVSGVNRFQEGSGSNQLVYGNCIQVDSSINPGNSGGPLFNMDGEVIGINGRGSFEARGRVNVGLGYAISSNQIRHFIPDLLATKLIQHGTLDATFAVRDRKIVCDSIEQDCEARKLGLELGDELLEFEETPIATVNQYLNLLCTLPEGWPAKLKIRKSDAREQTLIVRLYGLPYNIPAPPAEEPTPDPPTPEQEKEKRRRDDMVRLMTTNAGTIRDPELNQQLLDWLMAHWRNATAESESSGEIASPRGLKVGGLEFGGLEFEDELLRDGEPIGRQRVLLEESGRFRVEWQEREQQVHFAFDGEAFWRWDDSGAKQLTLVEAKLTPQIIQVVGIASQWEGGPWKALGTPSLDGGDKASGQLACRAKILDANKDWLFCWFSLFDDASNITDNPTRERGSTPWSVRPLKIAGDLDSSGTAPAVCFADWQPVGESLLPFARTWVRGRGEVVDLVARTTSATPTETIDPQLFSPPPNTIPGEADLP